MRHWLLRFVAALFFATGVVVSFDVHTTGGPDEVEARCVAGGGVHIEVCTPWN